MAAGNLGSLNVFLNLNMAGFVAKLQTAKGQLNSLGATVKANSALIRTMGLHMMLAGAAIGAALGIMVKGAMDFETGMAKVQTMLKDTELKYLPTFRRELRAMAVEYGQSMKTLTDGTYDVLSAQMGAAKAMDFMRIASKAAVGGFTDTKTAVSALLTIMKTYKGTIKSVGDAADWMHAVVERGRLTFEDLANTIGTSIAMAAQAGMTIEDYGTALAVLTKGGLSAEKSQTAMRGILRSVLKVQEDAGKTAKKLGLEWNVDALRADNFVNTLRKLNGAQIEYLSKLSPNIRGLLGWAVALSDVNEAALDHAAILDRAGLTQKKFEVGSKILSFKMQQLKASFNDLRIILGDKLIPVVQNIVIGLTNIIGKFSKFAESHPVLTRRILELTAALSGLLIALGLVAVIVGTVSTISIPITAAIVGIVGALYLSVSAIKMWGGEIKAFFYSISTGMWDLYKGMLETARAINTIFMKLSIGSMKDFFLENINTLNRAIRRAEDNIKITGDAAASVLEQENEKEAAIRKAIEALKEQGKAFGGMSESATEAMLKIEDSLDKLKNGTDNTFNFMEELATQSAHNIQNAFSTFFFQAFKGELQSAKEAFAEFGNAVLQMMANLAAEWVALQIMTGIKTGLGMLFGGGAATTSTGATGMATAGQSFIASHAAGTPYIPQTGLYKLHKGEAVIDAQKNSQGGGTTIQPVVVIQAWDARDVSRNMDTISNGLAQSLRSNSNFREAVKKYGR